MLKGKLKLPQKVPLQFPQRLSSLVAGFESKEAENVGIDPGFELAKELETFQPDGLRLDVEAEVHSENPLGKFDGNVLEQGTSKTQKNDMEAINIDEKRSDLEYEISQKVINLEKLQRFASLGIPDGRGLRPTIWKLLLGYLPASRDIWEKELSESRERYAKLKEELLKSPSIISREKNEELEPNEKHVDNDIGGPLERHNVLNEDHPLGLGKTCVWHQYFEFTEITEQIDRDLDRTHPNIKFFSGESLVSKKNKESMRNILLLFAKLNPEISYVQGMNEVLAPLYYVFSTDCDKENASNAEADCFSCFLRLMTDSVDHFCQQLDNSPMGIHSTLLRLSELLKANDEELWRHLELKNKVNPQFYAFRWITLLLTQEFSFQTILRIWDSLLSNPFGIQDMLLRICCAMLLCVKSRLINGDFVDNLNLLQHYPEMYVNHVLQVAQDITPERSSFHRSL